MEVKFSVPDLLGYYGDFGGAFIPEMLYGNVENLRSRYLSIIEDKVFQADYDRLLRDYVGRPTPLFYAERLSARFRSPIFLTF